jgi:hypothetical protein
MYPRELKLGALAALAAAALLASAAPAGAAKLDAGDVKGSTAIEFTFPSSPAIGVGNYLSCAGGQRTISGGALWHKTGQDPSAGGVESSWLVNTTVTGDDLGWYADGATTTSDLSFTIRALCVPGATLSHAVLRQRTVQIPLHKTATAQVKCGGHTQVITGGSFIHRPGEGPTANDALFARTPASFPTGNGWAAGGRNFAPNKFVELSLTVYALCQPQNRVKDVHLRRHTTTVGAGRKFFEKYDCPGKEAVLTGGAYLHKPRKSFKSGLKSGVLAAEAPLLPKGSKWLSGGLNAEDARRAATTNVLCLEG